MLGGGGSARADRRADYHRGALLSAGHIAYLSHLVYDLIHCHQHEVRKHDFNNGAHTGQSHADAHTNETGFADGRILHAQITVFFV